MQNNLLNTDGLNQDECALGTDNCDNDNADCTNIDTSPGFYCTCHDGFDDQNNDGSLCVDRNECTNGEHNCDEHAQCTNTDGSYTCTCNDGWEGDGFSCIDVDECQDQTDECDHVRTIIR